MSGTKHIRCLPEVLQRFSALLTKAFIPHWCLSVFLLFTPPVLGITWEFEEAGDPQGWMAAEGMNSFDFGFFLSPLKSEVEDGVWRIYLEAFDPAAGLRPSVQLVSPPIGHDSELFDRFKLRLRVVGPQPLEGGAISFKWTNTLNQAHPGASLPCAGLCPSPFSLWMRDLTFSTEWQEVAIRDLRSGAFTENTGDTKEILWEEELLDLRPELLLASAGTALTWPQAVEIDQIVLTGVGELLQGELPPPAVETAAFFGERFNPPAFFPILQSGLGGGDLFSPGSIASTSGAIGDLDGDGDLDLVFPYLTRRGGIQGGVVSIFNDGHGRFISARSDPPLPGFAPYLNGADIDADGRMDLLQVWGAGNAETAETKILFNVAGKGWVLGQEFSTGSLGWADADGDGLVDLWRRLPDEASRPSTLMLHLNDGAGHFQEPLRITIDSADERYYPFKWVHRLGEGQSTGVLWWGERESYKMTSLEEEGEIAVTPLGAAGSPSRAPHYAGDVDGDNDIDLVVSYEEVSMPGGSRDKGLSFLWNRGDGSFDREVWLPEVLLSPRGQPEPVQFLDLNGDSRLDIVLVDFNERQPAVLVGLGQEEGPPLLEGRYPFEGLGGIILGGDLDGDGDIDLVMTNSSSGNEGVYVWLNQSEPRTAVMAEAGATPSLFQLTQNYPNPFNPQTWIPFEISADGGPVDLRIYNILGQPIRTLVAGRLGAGHHLVPWDGRDSQGQVVSAGVYLYRLQAGDGQITRKMLKVE